MVGGQRLVAGGEEADLVQVLQPFLLSISLVSKMLSYQSTNDSGQEVGAARSAYREHHVLGCLREARRVCCEDRESTFLRNRKK